MSDSSHAIESKLDNLLEKLQVVSTTTEEICKRLDAIEESLEELEGQSRIITQMRSSISTLEDDVATLLRPRNSSYTSFEDNWSSAPTRSADKLSGLRSPIGKASIEEIQQAVIKAVEDLNATSFSQMGMVIKAARENLKKNRKEFQECDLRSIVQGVEVLRRSSRAEL